MSDDAALDELARHLERTFGLPRARATRVIAEVVGYYGESVEEHVVRRHRELQLEGMTNPTIFERLEREIAGTRFRAPALTPRQLRRMVYG